MSVSTFMPLGVHVVLDDHDGAEVGVIAQHRDQQHRQKSA